MQNFITIVSLPFLCLYSFSCFTPVTITTVVISVSVVTMVTIVIAVVVAVTCYLLIRKHKLSKSLAVNLAGQ